MIIKNITYIIIIHCLDLLLRNTYILQMLLAIKDVVDEDSSDYNILLANTNGVPEKKKGLNNLKHDVTVGATHITKHITKR